MKRKWLIVLAALILVLPGLLLSSSCTSSERDLRPRAAIIDQVYVLQPNQAFIAEVTELLEAHGFRVDVYQGKEVTVDFYRELARYGYRLIIFRVHAGILEVGEGPEKEITEGTWLFTDEAYSMAKYPSEQLTDQLGAARIDETQPWVFAVGAGFITRSIRGEFPDTAIIMMGCSTLYHTDLAQAFIQKGASAYLGWHATVDLSYVDEATLSLIRMLVAQRLTVDQAVRETMAEMGPDPTWRAALKYYPLGSGKQTITQLTK